MIWTRTPVTARFRRATLVRRRLFVGVKTTGIYCRRSARRGAEAGECALLRLRRWAQAAGFALPRCRPETSRIPAPGAARPALLTRAWPDRGRRARRAASTLAARLGVGERQLRRLFQRKLGHPDRRRQTRRIHLAKQLIHETSLPMTRWRWPPARQHPPVQRPSSVCSAAPAALRRSRAPADAAGAAVSLHLAYRRL